MRSFFYAAHDVISRRIGRNGRAYNGDKSQLGRPTIVKLDNKVMIDLRQNISFHLRPYSVPNCKTQTTSASATESVWKNTSVQWVMSYAPPRFGIDRNNISA